MYAVIMHPLCNFLLDDAGALCSNYTIFQFSVEF